MSLCALCFNHWNIAYTSPLSTPTSSLKCNDFHLFCLFPAGTVIRVFAAGRELIAQAEDILNSPEWRGLWSDRLGPLLVQRMEFISNSCSCSITFTSTGQSAVPGELTVIATCVPYHTFFVADKGMCLGRIELLSCCGICEGPLTGCP